MWTEFLRDEKKRRLREKQGHELDADGYSAYLLLANLLQDENRYASVLQAMGHAEKRTLLVTNCCHCFFIIVLNVCCAFWRERTEVSCLYNSCILHRRYESTPSSGWRRCCRENGPVAKTWFHPSRFTGLFRIAAMNIPGIGKQTWDSQMASLKTPEGEKYERELSEAFEAARKGRQRA